MPHDIRPAQALPADPGKGVTRSFATFRAVSALILREMATRYGRSPGGYVWALLEPLGVIIVMALAFSLMLRNPPLGNSFILFYATGFLPFQVYNTIAGMIASAMMFSRPLLQYPAVTWIDAVLARLILNALTGVLVTLLLLSALVSFGDTRVLVDLPPMVVSILMAVVLGAGIGTLNCALFSLFPVYSQFWGILTRPLVLASGVIFLYDDLPRTVQDILWYNPLIHVTGLMRTGFYPTYRADYVDLTFGFACGLAPLFLGVVLMGRYHRDILSNN